MIIGYLMLLHWC